MSDIFDKIEKVKKLHNGICEDDKIRRECKNYIANNITDFYKLLTPTQFVEIVDCYKDCFKNKESNIMDILKSKNIPYILGYSEYEGEITQKLIEERAYESYKNNDFVEGLEYIKLLSQKYNIEGNMLILKGDILRHLGGYNGAIEAYENAKKLKNLYFTVNNRILLTKSIKYKKELILSTSLILIIIIGQFVLFDTGVIESKLYNFNINLSEDRYYIEDKNTIIIPLGSKLDINIDYQIMPFYGYEGQISYKIGDENVAKLDGNNKLSGISEGSTIISIIRDGKTVYEHNLIVAKSKIEHMKISIDNELSKVGDKGTIQTEITRNYDFNEKNQINYKSSNEKVLVVDENGLVEVAGAGKASVIVSCEEFRVEEEIVIGLIVENIEVEYDVELEVDGYYQLNIDVETNSADRVEPKVIFGFEDEEDNNNPIIMMDRFGKIKGLREGTQIVLVTCGDVEKRVVVTVNPKKITNYKVENLKIESNIKEQFLDINLSWSPIETKDSYEYQIYARFNHEDAFNKVGTISKENSKYALKFDISEFSEDSSVELYVVASNTQGESKKSNIETVTFSYKDNGE